MKYCFLNHRENSPPLTFDLNLTFHNDTLPTVYLFCVGDGHVPNIDIILKSFNSTIVGDMTPCSLADEPLRFETLIFLVPAAESQIPV